jgi:hypothetical protein
MPHHQNGTVICQVVQSGGKSRDLDIAMVDLEKNRQG